MRTDCIVKLSKLQISELNTLVQKETSGDVEGKPPPSDNGTRLKRHYTRGDSVSFGVNGYIL
jgi:hypothetical protein